MCTPFFDLRIQLCPFNPSYLIPNHFQLLVWYGLQTLWILQKGHFPFNLKFWKFWLVHQIDHFGLVWPEYLGPLVVHFDWSGHFGCSDQKVPFNLTKLLSPVPLFCFLLTRTITKRMVAWVGSVQPECTIPLGTWNFRNFKPDFSPSHFQFLCQSRISWGFWVTDHLPLPWV